MSELVAEAMEAIAQPKTNRTDKTRRIAIFVSVLRETSTYKVGNIDYSVESDPNGNTSVSVWSKGHFIDTFYDPSLAIVADLMNLGNYVALEKDRVIFKVFA